MSGNRSAADQPPSVLVIDVGSSSARCWLFDSAARGRDPGPGARIRYAWNISAGGMRMDAASLFADVATTIDAAVAHSRQAGIEIAAVAVTTFWHSLVGLDDAGEPVTSVTAWGDTRAAAHAARMAEAVDGSRLHQRTGCFVDASYPLVRLSWLRAEAHSLFGRAKGWGSFAEYMERRLFGECRCSFSMASGSGLLDVHRLAWDEEALEIAGIEARQLSRLVDFSEPITGLRKQFAERWPELTHVPWYPALGDGACANLGSGAVGPDRLGITIGTTAAVRVLVTAEKSFQVPHDLWTYRLDRRRVVVGGAFSNGGNALRFLSGNLRLPPEDQWDQLLRASDDPDVGLTVIPFLTGERGPGSTHDPGGSIHGLRLETTPDQLLRAWLESIGYQIARVCERLEVLFGGRGTPRASGGALQSNHAWVQILSDILGRRVILPAEREETSRGAAIMALEALGLLRVETVEEPAEAAAFEPSPEQHARHVLASRKHRKLADILSKVEPETGSGIGSTHLDNPDRSTHGPAE
ncbi:gluconokinase [soil metagenome]